MKTRAGVDLPHLIELMHPQITKLFGQPHHIQDSVYLLEAFFVACSFIGSNTETSQDMLVRCGLLQGSNHDTRAPFSSLILMFASLVTMCFSGSWYPSIWGSRLSPFPRIPSEVLLPHWLSRSHMSISALITVAKGMRCANSGLPSVFYPGAASGALCEVHMKV